MRIALFDYVVTPNNAIGNCHRQMMQALAGEHDFTLFSCDFSDPAPGRIRWTRVPAIARPLAALFITYHFASSLLYWWRGVGKRSNYHLVHGVESNFLFADVIAAHFCHRVFLDKHWKNCGVPGLRGAFRWLDHYFHSVLEPFVFRRARQIVVPSQGLKRELVSCYPDASKKIVVVSNPINSNSAFPPADFDRAAFRTQWGAADSDLLLSFVALGHYERKGLPTLLEVIAKQRDLPLKLVVIGGQPDLVQDYENRCARLGISDKVRFAGMQTNTRPFFWASDAFVFPSFYETFSLVAFEAAAAGCPLVVPRLNGVEEFLVDGETGIMITPDTEGVERGLRRLAGLSPVARNEMVLRAAECVRHYNTARFVQGWRQVYAGLAREQILIEAEET